MGHRSVGDSVAWTSRLPHDEALLEELAARVLAQKEAGAGRRAAPRHRLLIGSTIARLGPTSEDAQLYEVYPYDLSESGIGVLHGASVRPETLCRVALRAGESRGWTMIDGVVKRCEHVDGNVHDLGIQFAAPIDIATFVPQDS